MKSYSITVERGATEGKLRYEGGVTVESICWWDPAVRIDADTYAGCSKTRMVKKDRDAIYIPNVPGHSGIFIHKGKNASWSDGCIVLPDEYMQKILADIKPTNGRNITVIVRDESTKRETDRKDYQGR